MKKYRYVGNIHPQVTEPLLQEVFSSIGPIEGCKLIRKEKVWFPFRLSFGAIRTLSIMIISTLPSVITFEFCWTVSSLSNQLVELLQIIQCYLTDQDLLVISNNPVLSHRSGSSLNVFFVI